MIIREMKHVSMAESLEIVENAEEKNEHIIEYFTKFVKIKPADAKKMREDLEGSGIMKLNEETVAKIIDVLPESASDVNKIFLNESLDENEINKILEIVKKYT